MTTKFVTPSLTGATVCCAVLDVAKAETPRGGIATAATSVARTSVLKLRACFFYALGSLPWFIEWPLVTSDGICFPRLGTSLI